MGRKSDALTDVEVLVHHETDKAYLVTLSESDEAVWVPKSQCELDGKILTLPEWLAVEKGLV